MSKAPMMEPAQALRQTRKRFSPLAAALMASLAFFIGCAVCTRAPEAAPAAQEADAAPSRFAQLVPEGAGGVVSLALSGGGDAFTLHAQDGVLRLADEETALDQSAARELLDTGASVIARQTLSGDPADYGVDSGALCAVYSYESGASFTLMLGDAVPTGEGWYAAVQGSEAIYVVNNALAATLRGGRQALYALPDLAERFTANTLLSAAIELPGQGTLTLERVTQENPFNTKVQLTSPIRYPANAERAAEVYLALEDIRLTGVAQIGGADEDWGLSEPAAVITLTDKETTTLTIGKKDDLNTLRISGDPNVYTVDGACLAFLGNISVPYLAEQLPALVMLNQLSAFEVKTQEETLTFSVDQSAGAYAIGEKTIAPEDFVPVYQQMIGLLIERYAPDVQVPEQMRVSMDFTFKDGQRWQIAFARYDDQFDLVVRDGCACFLLSKEKTDAVLAALRSLK